MDQQTGADRSGNRLQQTEERRALLGGEGLVVIGVGEMRIDPTPLESRFREHEGEEFSGLLMPDARSAHAGVDLDVDLRAPVAPADERGERLCFAEGI